MRLPWLQVEQDGIAQCKRLAGLLGIPASQGIGIGVCVWQYALEVAPEGDFRGFVPDPGILAVEVGWPEEDAQGLISKLQRVGIVATSPSLRVRGLARYIRAWEKNTGKKAIYRDCGDVVPEPGANPAPLAPVPARQTQTQTQIHTTTKKHVRAPGVPEVDELKSAWNELTTAPIARWLAGRDKLAQAALERRPLEQWREVFARIEASSFCRGADGGWVADIDWALRAEGKKPETALKVLEGAFDRGSRAPPGPNARAPQPVADWTNADAGEQTL